METIYCVYLLTNKAHQVFYVGVTSNLPKRVYEHKHHLAPGFTNRYNVTKLIYYEAFGDVELAIQREKRLKRWPRAWKVKAIEDMNPEWNDLYESICN